MGFKVAVILFIILIYSFRSSRKPIEGLCLLIVLMGLMENRDYIPRAMAGIPGLNAWNILFLATTLGWLSTRQRNDPTPGIVLKLFFLYSAIVMVSHIRLATNPTYYLTISNTELLIDYFFKPLKFIVPSVIVFDYIKTREQSHLIIFAILAGYLLLAFQIIRYMGVSDFSAHTLNKRGIRVIARDTGYHRVDASAMLAGASWACYATLPILKKKAAKIAFIALTGACLLAVALTGGRTGLVAWGATGVFLCVLKWRKLIPLFPVALLALFAVLPGVRERLLVGFGSNDAAIVEETDDSKITSGRTQIWPLVIDKIEERPIFGHGREGMRRSGLTETSKFLLKESWGQPHNAYFEVLLDNGIIGIFTMIPIYLLAFFKSLALFLKSRHPTEVAIGGITLALLTSFFTSSVGSQTFYPRQGMIALWCAMALSLRLYYFPLKNEKEPAPQQ